MSTLVQDIYDIMDPTKPHSHDSSLATNFAMNVGIHFAYSLEKEEYERSHGKLWASDLGKKCHRQLWYKWNLPSEGEPLAGHTRFKFLYGNLLEESVLYLAKEAGHEVSGEQSRVEIELPKSGWKVSGKIDAIIDNQMVDVKSTSSYGFKKYSTEGLTHENDSFGYIEQLSFYHQFGTEHDKAKDPAFLWIDKQNGHLLQQAIRPVEARDIVSRGESIVEAVVSKVEPPRAFSPEPYGKSGNMKLPISCAYCDFKKECWKDSNDGKGLQGYAYSQGPVFFTEISRPVNKNVPKLEV